MAEHNHKWHPIWAAPRQNDWEIVWVCTDDECPGPSVKTTTSVVADA